MKEFIRIKEAAKILGVTYLTVWKWIKKGKIKAKQLQGKKGVWLINKEELYKLIGG